MCSFCRTYPCHPQCPYAPEPKAVYDCDCCNEPIIEGEEYYEIEGKHYHEDCLEYNSLDIFISLGAEKKIAEDL